MAKQRLILLYGGRSAEREVSVYQLRASCGLSIMIDSR